MTESPRLPFDPDRVAADESASRSPRDNAMTVTQIASQVKQVITGGFPAKVRVVGQVSNLSNRAHWFFSLKDEGAAIRCVCFASSARKINFDVNDGMEVIATGRVDYYPEQGQIQLYVDKLEPVGQGALEIQFRALCEELRGKGYFDTEHKLPLPTFARRIAVVTSRSAAALQDVIDTASQIWAGCQLFLVDVRVQGTQAADEIAKAIGQLSSQGTQLGIDAILLTRGGGSIEDLWAFNEKVVADAVFHCELPIAAAIGHETDTTIAELVADSRCATPTQAAMVLVPDYAALALQVGQLSARLSLLTQQQHQAAVQRLAAVMRHQTFRSPDKLYEPIRRRLDELAGRLLAAGARRLTADRRLFEALARQLHTIGPSSVLDRGYSYTLSQEGQVVRSVNDAKNGELITTVLADGKLHSRIEKSNPRTRKKPRPDTQPNLFEK
jgi:exodeoxyribonuclease VII large subunit